MLRTAIEGEERQGLAGEEVGEWKRKKKTAEKRAIEGEERL